MTVKLALTYGLIYVLTMVLLALLPTYEWMVWEQGFIIPVCALLMTLLVYLSAALAGTGNRPAEVMFTALFLLIFSPGVENFFSRDEGAILELASQCIVPFFIGQYNRVSTKDYRHVYALMLLMGIFCSYTHDGITIPLCAGFLWLAFVNRSSFFRTACWPMVIGFAIGTSLSVWQHLHRGDTDMPTGLQAMFDRTGEILLLLWNTKIFIVSIALTSWLSFSRWGRRMLMENFHRQTLLCSCAMLSYCVLPFAPLGLENAVTGVCFFSMFWVLLLFKSLADKFIYKNTATPQTANKIK